jgi:hypothetical protein
MIRDVGETLRPVRPIAGWNPSAFKTGSRSQEPVVISLTRSFRMTNVFRQLKVAGKLNQPAEHRSVIP